MTTTKLKCKKCGYHEFIKVYMDSAELVELTQVDSKAPIISDLVLILAPITKRGTCEYICAECSTVFRKDALHMVTQNDNYKS